LIFGKYNNKQTDCSLAHLPQIFHYMTKSASLMSSIEGATGRSLLKASKYAPWGNPYEDFSGKLDEVRRYGHALSNSEIQQLYTGNTPIQIGYNPPWLVVTLFRLLGAVVI
jgi:hypothetical protein